MTYKNHPYLRKHTNGIGAGEEALYALRMKAHADSNAEARRRLERSDSTHLATMVNRQLVSSSQTSVLSKCISATQLI